MAFYSGPPKLCSLCQKIDVSSVLFPEALVARSEDNLSEDRGYSKGENLSKNEPLSEMGTMTGDETSLEDKELKNVRLPHIALGLPRDIASRARTCDICSIVTEKLIRRVRGDPEMSNIEITGCTLIWLRYGGKAEASFFDKPHVSRFRLRISLEYQSSEATANLCSIEIDSVLQPALWPVPRLECQMEKPHWCEDDVRGGRIRPVVCDSRLLRRWLQTCEEKHILCQLLSSDPPPKLRVFDVEQLCLREIQLSKSERPSYIALSYVWGTAGQRRTLTKANCCSLSESGAIPLDSLSQTIADAAKVVKMLGERFMWVDALCIIQDDEDDLAATIPLMGQIYGGALLTIIAASSIDANSGLPGIRRGTRNYQRIIGPLGGGALLTCCTPELEDHETNTSYGTFPHYLKNSRWDTRAWTFQEKLFSRRRLFVMREQIYWECEDDSWCEESCFEKCFSEPNNRGRCSWLQCSNQFLSTFLNIQLVSQGMDMVNPLDYEYFSSLVHNFSIRYLSFEEDAPRAFASLFKTMSYHSGVHFWYGVPTAIFDLGIWWHGSQVVSREIANLPSWSWLAWKGAIDLAANYEPELHNLSQIACYRICRTRGGQKCLEMISNKSLRVSDVREITKEDIPNEIWPSLRVDFHIIFWAQTCLLNIQDNGRNISHIPACSAKTGEQGPNSHQTGIVYDSSSTFHGHHEFVLMQTEPDREGVDRKVCPRVHYLTLVSWHNGIARREKSAQIDIDEWEKRAAPVWKLIIME